MLETGEIDRKMKVINYSEDDSLIRLTKYQKKGILRIVFSRLLHVILLLALQVYIIFSFFTWLTGYIPYYRAITTLFTILMLFYLFNSDMDSSAKLTWLFIIALVPVPGALFYGFTRVEFGFRSLKERMIEIMSETSGIIKTHDSIKKKLRNNSSDINQISKYLNKTGCFPVFQEENITYYSSGEKMYEAILEEVSKAQHFIFLEYFIIEEGYMWGKLLKLLKEKADAGVDVRVMYDGMCEMKQLPYNYAKRLEAIGIRAKSFAPILPFISTYYNYRDHRKILVIDGKVAFNGGVNLADEYINIVKRFGYWKDSAVRVKGEAANAYTLMFLQMWSFDEKEFDYKKFLTVDSSKNNSKNKHMDSNLARTSRKKGYLIPFGDIPLDGYKVSENIYMDILNRADSYVHIMTPYLIMDDELENSIKFAAQRGIDVKIILPGIPDKKMAYSLAKSRYHSLLRSGVKIYEFTPGFIHSKNLVSDDKRAVVGTINLDYRSLYHHFECGTLLYETKCIGDIENDFQSTIKKCTEITIDNRSLKNYIYATTGKMLKLIAPLM